MKINTFNIEIQSNRLGFLQLVDGNKKHKEEPEFLPDTCTVCRLIQQSVRVRLYKD